MGHKSDSSSSSHGHHHHHHHHGHHHHQNQHHRRPLKSHREPSLHSITSSDLSSASSEASSVHQRSTPKIAAVIIAAIIVIAVLVGITVYLVDSERFEKKASPSSPSDNLQTEGLLDVKAGGVVPIMNKPTLDYQSYHDESSTVMQKFRHTTYREGKDPEGPEALYEGDEEYYEEDEDVSHGDGEAHDHHHEHEQDRQLVVDGHGGRRGMVPGGDRHYPPHEEPQPQPQAPSRPRYRAPAYSRNRARNKNKQRQDMFGNLDFGAKTAEDGSEESLILASASDGSETTGLPDANGNVYQPMLPNWNQHAPPQGPQVPMQNFRRDFYDLEAFTDKRPGAAGAAERRRLRPGQQFRRPGPQHLGREHAQRIVSAESVEEKEPVVGSEATSDLKGHPLPPSGSRGAVHVPVEDLDASEMMSAPPPPKNMNQLTTIDRRPGRPHFHHQGPPQNGRFPPAMRRRFQQQQFQRRMGLLQAAKRKQLQQQQQQDRPNPLLAAKRVLSRFEDTLKLANSEALMLREIARNITARGEEVNLWTMLYAVNSTMMDRPDSAITRLMHRFYDTYLAAADDPAAQNGVMPVKGVYEKRIYPVVFLAFGIFLLNSVNEIMAHQGVRARARGRSFEADATSEEALKALLTQRSELLELFPAAEGRSLDSGEPSSSSKAASVDDFLKLSMNLMNAYNSERDEELECIWSLYCHQLNRQASLGGMASSVARINSVGMLVVLDEMDAKEAPGAMIRNLYKWRQLPCQKMFPRCEKKFDQEEEEEGKQEEGEGGAESAEEETATPEPES